MDPSTTFNPLASIMVAVVFEGTESAAWRLPSESLTGAAAAPAFCTTSWRAPIPSAQVNPDIYANLPNAPLAWIGLFLFVLGLATVFSGQLRGRFLVAFLGSGAFIVGLLVATAACVFPVMLKSTLDPAWSLTAYNAATSHHGLVTGTKWWFFGFPIAVAYFVVLFRIHRGKVKAGAEGQGY